ncbi:hypothetical protein CEQ90_08725 [Lewinellaceae bacterium SD302]|nr:hypothetical protein CEQ90_08725 [Lewinellaceae bacterium SD302]
MPSLVANNNGTVILYELGSNNKAIAFNASGNRVWTETLEDSGCSSDRLITGAGYYDEDKGRFILFERCGSIVELSPTGSSVAYDLNISSPALGSFGASKHAGDIITLLTNNNGNHYQSEESGYSLIEEIDEFTGNSIAGAVGDNFLAYHSISTGNASARIVKVTPGIEPSGESFDVHNLNRNVVDFQIRDIAPIGNRLAMIGYASALPGGPQWMVLITDEAGAVEDTIFLEGQLEGVASTPQEDQSMILQLRDISNGLGSLYLLTFDREQGVVAESQLINDRVNRVRRFDLFSYSNGDALMLYYRNEEPEGFTYHVSRVKPDGEVVFDQAYLTGVAIDDISDLAIDENENCYFILENFQSGAPEMISLNGDGELRFRVEYTDDDFFGYQEGKQPIFNSSQDKLLFTHTPFSLEPVLTEIIEVSTQNGAVVERVTVSDGDRDGKFSMGQYSNNSDNIELIILGFENQLASSQGNRNLSFNTINEQGEVIHSSVLETGHTNSSRLLCQYRTNAGFWYATGIHRTDMSDRTDGMIIGVDPEEIVSVEEVNNLAETANLSVFPNPATEQTTVTWDNQNTSPYDLELVTAQGRRIKRWQGELAVGRASLDVDLSRLPVGTYLLRLTTDGGVNTQRVVKQ